MGQREILLLISRLLADLKIPYLLTGSFASSYYGFPRATHDIDFVVEIEMKDYPKLKRALNKLKKVFLIDLSQVRDSINRNSHFEILHIDSMIKVDFWPAEKSEFNISRFKRKKESVIFHEKIWIVSPEDLILNKLLWCRETRSERHLRDSAGIIKVQGKKLDHKYLPFWAKKFKVEDLLKEVSSAEY